MSYTSVITYLLSVTYLWVFATTIPYWGQYKHFLLLALLCNTCLSTVATYILLATVISLLIMGVHGLQKVPGQYSLDDQNHLPQNIRDVLDLTQAIR